MPFTLVRWAAITGALLTFIGCGVKSTETPPLAGPSGLAYSLQLSAKPDSINQNGMDQSNVSVIVIGPDGRPAAKAP